MLASIWSSILPKWSRDDSTSSSSSNSDDLGDRDVILWNLNHQNTFMLQEIEYSSLSRSIQSTVIYETSNQVILISGCNRHTIKYFDAHTGLMIYQKSTNCVKSLNILYSKSRNFLIGAGYDCNVMVWTLDTGTLVKNLVLHMDSVNVVDNIYVLQSRNGVVSGRHLIASGSSDQSIGIWEFDEQVWTLKHHLKAHETAVCAVKLFLLDNTIALCSGDDGGCLYVWDAFSGAKLFEMHVFGSVTSIAASHHHSNEPVLLSVASRMGALYVWEISSNSCKRRHVLSSNRFEKLSRSLVVFDECDERLLFAGCDDGIIRIWSLSSGQLLYSLEAHKSWVTCLHLTEGKEPLLVSSGCDGFLRVWDVAQLFLTVKYQRRKQFLMFLTGYRLLEQRIVRKLSHNSFEPKTQNVDNTQNNDDEDSSPVVVIGDTSKGKLSSISITSQWSTTTVESMTSNLSKATSMSMKCVQKNKSTISSVRGSNSTGHRSCSSVTTNEDRTLSLHDHESCTSHKNKSNISQNTKITNSLQQSNPRKHESLSRLVAVESSISPQRKVFGSLDLCKLICKYL